MLKTRDLHYAGRTVALPDLPEYRKFYGKLEAGQWEPRTFEILGRNLDRGTVYVDIGAWIGVTPLWASGQAKRVLAYEPDPKCLALLRELSASYANVEVYGAALSSAPSVTLNAVDGFGSSESSALNIGDGEHAIVPGIGIDEIMRQAGPDPTFVKIDIEGYEFELLAEISKLRNHNVRGLQLAVHPQLLEKSLSGGRLARKLKTALRVWQLSRVLRDAFDAPRLAKFPSVTSYILHGVLWCDNPKGADFVFERKAAGATGRR